MIVNGLSTVTSMVPVLMPAMVAPAPVEFSQVMVCSPDVPDAKFTVGKVGGPPPYAQFDVHATVNSLSPFPVSALSGVNVTVSGYVIPAYKFCVGGVVIACLVPLSSVLISILPVELGASSILNSN